jgi:hypothetical protein
MSNDLPLALTNKATRDIWHPLPPTAGYCTACGSIEVILNEVTGIRDFSDIGESAQYPTGYGCEVCG